MHPEPHTDLDNLNTVQHNLRHSTKGSNDAYDVTVSLTGFGRGSSSPCAFWHKDKGLWLVVHGDDFTSSGNEIKLKWLVREFEKKYITNVRGIVEPRVPQFEFNDDHNWILEWKSDRNTCGTDPLHVDMIINGACLATAKGLMSWAVLEQSEGEEELSKNDAFRIRSLAARCNFLSVVQ